MHAKKPIRLGAGVLAVLLLGAAVTAHGSDNPLGPRTAPISTTPAAPVQRAQAGDRLPQARIVMPNGEAENLATLTDDLPAAVVMMRRPWNTFTLAEVQALREIMADLARMGIPSIAISTDTPAALSDGQSQSVLPAMLLSDAMGAAEAALGLATAENRPEGWPALPPVFYLVDESGKIVFTQSGLDFRTKPRRSELISEAREIEKRLKASKPRERQISNIAPALSGSSSSAVPGSAKSEVLEKSSGQAVARARRSKSNESPDNPESDSNADEPATHKPGIGIIISVPLTVQ